MSPQLLILILTFTFAHCALYDFRSLYEWNQIEYAFESDEQKNASIANGTFHIGQVDAIDVQPTFIKGAGGSVVAKYFVTTPRLYSRVPATLSVITNKTIDSNPVLQPYPSWSWHVDLKKCSEKRIVSVSKLWADECGRLWVVDLGFDNQTVRCKPQILVFDIQTDELIYRHGLDEKTTTNISGYNDVTAEVLDRADSCLDTWLYVADPMPASLLVYSLKLNESWVVADASFEASVKWSNLTIDGFTFPLNYGIASLALSPPSDGDKRKLAYHALANINESYVYTKDIRNVSLLRNGGGDVFHTYPKPRGQQAGNEAYDAKGRLHFNLLNDMKLARWDNSKEYDTENFEIIGNDNKIFQFPTSVKIGNDEQAKESVWILATRYKELMTQTFTSNETNFKLLVANILP